MSRFDRILTDQALDALWAMTDGSDNWWKDLLRLWAPNGTSSRDQGLRLAVRRNYLNFYRMGQSVAKVGFTRTGQPYAEVHIKYASDNCEEAGTYNVRLCEGRFKNGTEEIQLFYRPQETVARWCSQAAKENKGKEKFFVDGVVSENAGVIDLEMGLPAYEGQRLTEDGKKRAPRIDLVALERKSTSLSIVFWEAKLINDSRLVAKETPKVLDQLEDYRKYLKDDQRRVAICNAYRSNCSMLAKLHEMASKLNPAIAPLGADVISVAMTADALDVDIAPRILIYDNGCATSDWPRHLDRLRGEEFGQPVPCYVVKEDRRLPEIKS
ncbi:MAG: hypothetical protein ACRECC_07270 [Pseudolabrys sp.]